MGNCSKKDTDAEKLNTKKNIEVYMIQMLSFLKMALTVSF